MFSFTFNRGDWVRLVDKAGCSRSHPIALGSVGYVIGFHLDNSDDMTWVRFDTYDVTIPVKTGRLLPASLLDRLTDV